MASARPPGGRSSRSNGRRSSWSCGGVAVVVGPEIFGSTVAADAFAKRATPLEVLLGAHWLIDGVGRIGGGIGRGLTDGVGAPAWRAIVAVEWAPELVVVRRRGGRRGAGDLWQHGGGRRVREAGDAARGSARRALAHRRRRADRRRHRTRADGWRRRARLEGDRRGRMGAGARGRAAASRSWWVRRSLAARWRPTRSRSGRRRSRFC